jgi:hypothetical protein
MAPRTKPNDSDVKSPEELEAEQAAQDAAAAAAAEGDTEAQARSAAERATEGMRLHPEERKLIAQQVVEELRDGGAFDAPAAAATPPAAAAGETPEATPPPTDTPAPAPRKLSRAEKFLGVTDE